MVRFTRGEGSLIPPITNSIRENFKYYFADYVRKGGEGGTPQIRNPLFAENFVRKGGGNPPYGQNPQSSI